MEEILKENVEFFITIGSTIVGIIMGIIGIQRYFHKQKLERLKDKHEVDIEKLKSQYDKESAGWQREILEENEKLKKTINEELDEEAKNKALSKETPLVQEEKAVYVKYIYIRRKTEPPVYQKYISRLGEYIDVHSEYLYYRFNKYNEKNNFVTIRDRSSGVVDLNILFPWRELIFTDEPSKKIPGLISQDLRGADTYFTVTTYYNGFSENNEDIAMKMEMDTVSARLIADFSSILNLDKLFIKEPDVYRVSTEGKKTKILGLEKLNDGVYHINLSNLKKGEVVLLDFHVNWNYLDEG